MKFMLLVALLAISACTSTQKAILNQGLEAAKQVKDTEAEVLKVSICAMSIGAYHRVNSTIEQRALDVLCGGEWDRPVTADDVRILHDLGELLRSE